MTKPVMHFPPKQVCLHREPLFFVFGGGGFCRFGGLYGGIEKTSNRDMKPPSEGTLYYLMRFQLLSITVQPVIKCQKCYIVILIIEL